MKATAPISAEDSLYHGFWRWHFYAGLFVIPFLLALSLSGLLMLLAKPLDSLLHEDLLKVEPQGDTLPLVAQLAAVESNYSDATVQLYIPPRRATDSAQFSVMSGSNHGSHSGGHGAPSTTVYLNPYTGKILGALDPATTFYSRIKAFHGSLYLGDLGDTMIEIAAGLSVLMVVSGLYLAFSRERGGKNRGKEQGLALWRKLKTRNDWRWLHRLIGLFIALPLLVFLISGLAWTNVWGGKLVQAWSSLPGTQFEAPVATEVHSAMNHEGIHQTPWVLEQTPLPEPKPVPAGGHSHPAMDLDAVSRIAIAQGFNHFRVHLPNGGQRVWSISATTIAGDLDNPTQERILHLTPTDGRVLADLRFDDYPLTGKAMAAFVPLHQGDLGWWNFALNLLLCTLIVVMIVSGTLLWWKRKPTNSRSLTPPMASPAVNRVAISLMLILALCFPLSAASIAVVLVIDGLVLSRFRYLRAILK